jgi:hypothetical protein
MMKRLVHASKFYYKAVRGMSRKQNLRLPSKLLSFNGRFKLGKKDKLAWFKLFQVADRKLQIPFTYFWPVAINQVMSAINNLKVNHRNIFHLSQKFIFNNLDQIDGFQKMELNTHIEDVVLYKEKRAIVILTAVLSNMQGEVVVNCEGAMLVKNLREADAVKLLHSTTYNHTDISHLGGLRDRTPKLSVSSGNKGSIYVPENFGVAFGKVSGDRNPVHTNSRIAMLFGYPKAFIQGMATLNFLLKLFVDDRKKQIRQIDITFCNPIFVGQEIQVNFTDKEYEVIDSRGKLTAFGTYEA